MLNHKWISLMLIALVSVVVSKSAMSADYNEKIQYLGTLNGQMQASGVVKVMRTLADPVLFTMQANTPLPSRLVIHGAQVRSGAGGRSYITVKQDLPDSKEARITLLVELWIDASRVSFTAGQRGEDVVISMPDATSRVELKTDAPAELEVSADYRGPLQIAFEITSE